MINRDSHKESRADLLKEGLLWGAPRTSDAAFLVSMRGRLNRQVSGLWLSARNALSLAGAAAILLVGVWLPGQNSGQRVSEELTTTTLNATVDEFVVVAVVPDLEGFNASILLTSRMTFLTRSYNIFFGHKSSFLIVLSSGAKMGVGRRGRGGGVISRA